MGKERGSSSEFMHKPGDMLLLDGVVHIVKHVSYEETPAGTDAEGYEAVCGAGSQSWGMPGVEMAQFASSLNSALKAGAIKCDPCFNPKEAK